MASTEVITVFRHKNMQRNEMAPFQKGNNKINSSGQSGVQSKELLNHTFFSPLVDKKIFQPNFLQYSFSYSI